MHLQGQLLVTNENSQKSRNVKENLFNILNIYVYSIIGSTFKYNLSVSYLLIQKYKYPSVIKDWILECFLLLFRDPVILMLLLLHSPHIFLGVPLILIQNCFYLLLFSRSFLNLVLIDAPLSFVSYCYSASQIFYHGFCVSWHILHVCYFWLKFTYFGLHDFFFFLLCANISLISLNILNTVSLKPLFNSHRTSLYWYCSALAIMQWIGHLPCTLMTWSPKFHMFLSLPELFLSTEPEISLMFQKLKNKIK